MGLLNIFDCIHQHTGMSRPEYQILPWGNPKLPASFKLKFESLFRQCNFLSAMKVQKCKKMIGFPWLCCLAWLWACQPGLWRGTVCLPTGAPPLRRWFSLPTSSFELFHVIKTTLQEKSITIVIKVEFFAKHLSILIFTSKSIMFQLSRWKFRSGTKLR